MKKINAAMIIFMYHNVTRWIVKTILLAMYLYAFEFCRSRGAWHLPHGNAWVYVTCFGGLIVGIPIVVFIFSYAKPSSWDYQDAKKHLNNKGE